jgi:hypothetical protein
MYGALHPIIELTLVGDEEERHVPVIGISLDLADRWIGQRLDRIDSIKQHDNEREDTDEQFPNKLSPGVLFHVASGYGRGTVGFQPSI